MQGNIFQVITWQLAPDFRFATIDEQADNHPPERHICNNFLADLHFIPFCRHNIPATDPDSGNNPFETFTGEVDQAQYNTERIWVFGNKFFYTSVAIQLVDQVPIFFNFLVYRIENLPVKVMVDIKRGKTLKVFFKSGFFVHRLVFENAQS
ncbi:hypothetical protein D3C85_1203780 [compost metagenome]